MKTNKHLLQYVQNFFQDYLLEQRGVSVQTVIAYRDALKLLFTFICNHLSKSPTDLELKDLEPDIVLGFLDNLERQRHNCARTRNLRLAALRTFFRYLAGEVPLYAGQYQRIVAIPLKQRSRSEIVYLDITEVRALLNGIGRKKPSEQRDYALLSFLYNTGARVQEACDLKVKDIQFSRPQLATLTGKGRKSRNVPLWPQTAEVLAAHLKNRGVYNQPDAWVFVNSKGIGLSRFGVRHILRKRVAAAEHSCPTLQRKRVTPHTFRHTTAMHLLQSGVDLAVIKSWLGHANFATTHDYVEIDLEMKIKALSKCEPKELAAQMDRIAKQNQDVIRWLDSL